MFLALLRTNDNDHHFDWWPVCSS